MNASFIFGAAAVCARATAAGIIASSNGSATTAPTPRRTVRRDKCFLVRNIMSNPLAHSVRYQHLSHLHVRLGGALTGGYLLHLKSRTRDDTYQDRREAIVVGGRGAHDPSHRRHVVIIERAAERIGHQITGECLHELLRAR